MRYGIVSDVHANIQAWKAVLRDMEKEGVDVILCLGDVIGYGPNPAEVLDSCYENVDYFLLGNHDAVIGNRLDSSLFNDNAKYLIEWTRDQLNAAAADFFGDMPLRMEGDGFVCAHGELAVPGRFGYIYQASDAVESFTCNETPLMFVGHTHLPAKIALNLHNNSIIDQPVIDSYLSPDERYLINVGSVGDPRDGQTTASYVIYDKERNFLRFRKVPFDINSFKRSLAKAQLPVTPFFLKVYDGAKAETQTIKDMEVMSANQAIEVKTKIQKISNVPSEMKSRRTKVTFSMDTLEQTRQFKARELSRKEMEMDDKKKGTKVLAGLLGGLFLVFLIVILAVRANMAPEKKPPEPGPSGGTASKNGTSSTTGGGEVELRTPTIVKQSEDGSVVLGVSDAEPKGSLIIDKGRTQNWESKNQGLSWKINLEQTGYFKVHIKHNKKDGEADIHLNAPDSELKAQIKASENPQQELGVIELKNKSFVISLTALAEGPVTSLESLSLEYIGKHKPNPFGNLEDVKFTDFENPLYPAGWSTKGTGFNYTVLNSETMIKGWSAAGVEGNFFAASVNNNFRSLEDALKAKGRLISPEFEIKHRFVNMLLTGGGDNSTQIILTVNDKEVLSKSLPNSKDKLVNANLDLVDYIGAKKARLVFKDNSSKHYVAVDRITFTNKDVKEFKSGSATITGKENLNIKSPFVQKFNEAGRAFVSGNFDETVALLKALKKDEQQGFVPYRRVSIKATETKTEKGNELKQADNSARFIFKKTKGEFKRDTFIISGEFKQDSMRYLQLDTHPYENNKKFDAGTADGNFVLSQMKMKITREPGEIRGRYIQIYKKTASILSLAEVEVFSGGKNVALNKKAYQSSVNHGGEASKAVDGNTDGVFSNNSTTHTNGKDKPWWIVDLGKEFPIEKISIHNRTDAEPSRLDKSTVSILNTDKQITWQKYVEKAETVKEHHPSNEFDVDFTWAWASYSQPGNNDKHHIKNSILPSENGWAVGGKINYRHNAFFLPKQPISLNRGDKFEIRMLHNFINKNRAYFLKSFALYTGLKKHHFGINKTINEIDSLKNIKKKIMDSYKNDIGKEVDFFVRDGNKIKVTVFGANDKGVGVKAGKKTAEFAFEKLCLDELKARCSNINNGLIALYFLKDLKAEFKNIKPDYTKPLDRLVIAGTKGFGTVKPKGVAGRYIEVWQQKYPKGNPNWRFKVDTDKETITARRSLFRSNELYPGVKFKETKLISLFDLGGGDKQIKSLSIDNGNGETQYKTIIIRNSRGEVVWQRSNNTSAGKITKSSKYITVDPDYLMPLNENLALNKPYKQSTKSESALGINDGFWINSSPFWYATGSDKKFPKYVTIDLGEVKKINALRFSKAHVGGTREVIFSLGKDENEFKEVGRKIFQLSGDKERQTLHIGEQEGRFIRVEFKNNYNNSNGHSNVYQSFLTELEAYHF